ncbi:MAG: hypothetical protein OQJ97_04230 [Rhodospirillales bacterium]|nr:hypothetical protein [Rhodospirillales bacterium]
MNQTSQDSLKRRTFWTRIGYLFSAAWIAFILMKTEGDMSNPWFDSIFLVPLGAWALGLLVARLISGKPPQEKP